MMKKNRSDPTRKRRPETRRNLRPLQHRCFADLDELDLEDEEERETKGRRKLKLVLKLPTFSSLLIRHVSASGSATSSSDDEEEVDVKPRKKRRVERVGDLESKRNVIKRPIRAVSAMLEKKSLKAILDKFKKKDTYGVFAELVNLKELPYYHDVIEHPMDFGTVRRKLVGGRYRSFEQFEDDVFLICSNAMQYNAPDTIYFRQAHSIQDMARKIFQEIRADVKSNGGERKSVENIRSVSTQKNTVKRLQSVMAPMVPDFDISSLEKKTLKQLLYSNAIKPLRCDISSMKKKARKKQCRTASEPPRSVISTTEKETLEKPMYRTNRTDPEPSGSDISSMEKTTSEKTQYITKGIGSGISSVKKITLEKPLYRTERMAFDISSTDKKPLKKHHNRSKWVGSNISSMENATPKKTHCRNEQIGSDISSMEKTAPKKPQYRTERISSSISSVEKTALKKPQHKTEWLVSDISYMEKSTLKKPQCMSERLASDISSLEKMTLKKLHCRNECEPLGSDISSEETKTPKEQQGRIAPEILDSDNSTGAMRASAADAFNGLSKIPANDNTSATDTCFGLATVKTSRIERDVTNDGSADGSSSLGEAEKSDEVPANCLPSKLELQQFEVDVNRRATYNTLEEQPMVETDSVFDAFEDKPTKLAPVGLNSEYSYARSLARFAAFLGPIGWEMASKKIKQSLPAGVKFGPGWVGDYEPVLTPNLSLQSSTKQQLPVTSEDKGNEIKPETTRIGQHKDMPLALKSEMMTKMPCNRISSHSNEERERIQEKKWGLFAVNLELQQNKNNQPAGDLSKAYANKNGQNRPDVSSGVARCTSPAKIWNKMRIERQNPQQKKNQAGGDLAKAYTNDLTRHRSELCFGTRLVNLPAISYEGRSVKTEPLEQPISITSQCKRDQFGMNSINVRDFSNIRNSVCGQNPPSGIISSQQAGVQYWLSQYNQHQAINNPLRLMITFGKLIKQPKTSNRCNHNLEQSMLTFQIPKREVGSVSFNSPPKTPSPGFRVYEAAEVKLEPLEVEGVTENFQAQMTGLVIFPQLMTNNLSRLQAPWHGLVQRNKQKDMLPPDLNISFQTPGSPARSSFDSQQPDLALQL